MIRRVLTFGIKAEVIEWRTLPWLPEYEISEFGQLRRTTDSFRRRAGGILKGHLANGYHRYVFSLSGQRRDLAANRLVCEAWHGSCPDGRECAHGDGNKLNNHYSNLRWATPAENSDDKNRHGTLRQHERSPVAKLNWETVSAIRSQYTGKFGQKAELARRYGISDRHMTSICRGDIWRSEDAPAEELA